jgi:hypothetical protein
MNDLPLNLDPELLVAYVDKELPPAQMGAVDAALMHNGAARETSTARSGNPQLREATARAWKRPSSISAGPMFSRLPTGLSPICS